MKGCSGCSSSRRRISARSHRAGGPRQVVNQAAAHAQQAGLARDRQGVVSVDHGLALSNPALLNAHSNKSFSSASWPTLACSGARSTGGAAGLPELKTPAATSSGRGGSARQQTRRTVLVTVGKQKEPRSNSLKKSLTTPKGRLGLLSKTRTEPFA